MTLKTSFFNKGIYKSTVKRYIWGFVAYFLLLFLTGPLVLFMNRSYYLLTPDTCDETPLILQSSYLTVPMLTAIVAPVIVSLLAFRFIHSKNQSVFIHSLPLTRCANYLSTMAASFTLMALPIILNGLILLVMSFCGYGAQFGAQSCVMWVLYQLFGIYMMFSVAVFSANLTGNSFAAVAVNVIIHSFLFIVFSAFYIMAEVFIHGFAQPDTLLEILAENNFAYACISLSNSIFRESITAKCVLVYICAPAVLFVASFFLYKNRKLETASDVSGFKCLNSVFKYTVCFLATMFVFAALSYKIAESPLVTYAFLFIISIFVYFACEMLLKKTMKVFYSWKGYLGFAAAFFVIVLFFSQTSFFGYETRVPKKEDISSVAVYSYYPGNEKPYCSGDEIINLALDAHKKFVSDEYITKINSNYENYNPTVSDLHIDYKLKDGSTLTRSYQVALTEIDIVNEKLYSTEEYKKAYEPIFMPDSQIDKIWIGENAIENQSELIKALRDDYLKLSYSKLYLDNTQNPDDFVSLDVYYYHPEPSFGGEAKYNWFNITVKPNFENAYNWLKEKGYTE